MFKDWIDDEIAMITADLFGGFDDLLNMNFASGPYKDVWMAITGIFDSVLLPIGIGMCALCFVISLLDKVTMEQFTLEQFFRQFIKLMVVLYIIKDCLLIVNYALSFGSALYKEMSAQLIPDNNSVSLVEQFHKLEGYSQGKLSLWLTLMIPTIFSWAMSIVVRFICYSRLIEIYLKTMFTPIAIGDIIIGGVNSNGVRYLKGLLALGLQGIVIFGISYIYSFLNTSLIAELATEESISVWSFTAASLSIGFAAVGLLVKSLSITKEIVGA